MWKSKLDVHFFDMTFEGHLYTQFVVYNAQHNVPACEIWNYKSTIDIWPLTSKDSYQNQ